MGVIRGAMKTSHTVGTYLSILGHEPFAVETMGPELAGPFVSRVVAPTIGATLGMRAGLARRGGGDGGIS